jgi:NhaP-type Na+/H+ or K+/H+ antiporter
VVEDHVEAAALLRHRIRVARDDDLVRAEPERVLEPDLALTLFVAPVLLDAAFDASGRDLRANWRPVAGLAVAAVAV